MFDLIEIAADLSDLFYLRVCASQPLKRVGGLLPLRERMAAVRPGRHPAKLAVEFEIDEVSLCRLVVCANLEVIEVVVLRSGRLKCCGSDLKLYVSIPDFALGIKQTDLIFLLGRGFFQHLSRFGA